MAMRLYIIYNTRIFLLNLKRLYKRLHKTKIKEFCKVFQVRYYKALKCKNVYKV